MASFLLNTIALDPNRWTSDKQPYFDLIELLPPLIDAGFNDLEVWQYHLSTLDDGAFDRLATRARALGVSLPVVGAYPILDAAGDDEDENWEETARLLLRAAALGAEAVKFFAGRHGAADVPEAAYTRSISFARQMADFADELDLLLTVETHPDTLCDSVIATQRFLADVAADNLAVCFQPYDFADTAQTIADFRALSGHVRHLHLQGRRNDRMSLLQDADIDYRAFLNAVSTSGFSGYVCLEFVADCVVSSPQAFDLDQVLTNALRDRRYLHTVAQVVGLSLGGPSSGA